MSLFHCFQAKNINFAGLPFLYRFFCLLIKSRTEVSVWNSSVIRQKGESQNRCFKKTKLAKFSEKRTFLTLQYAHEGVRIVLFSENFACFAFLLPPFWDLPFCLITNETLTFTKARKLKKMITEKLYLKITFGIITNMWAHQT